MNFASLEFIFLFLPSTLILWRFVTKSKNYDLSLLFLLVVSIIFYAYWSTIYAFLLITSILINYVISMGIEKLKIKSTLFISGILFNLFVLGYYKYYSFFLNEISSFGSFGFDIPVIILPLAISFFTFQQIAYLVDVFGGRTKRPKLLEYSLFVCFFPQLIAGPIVKLSEILPQYRENNFLKPSANNLALGSSIFLLGLFKKLVIADNLALISDPLFSFVSNGSSLNLFESWVAALSFTFQIYFDFSGYSDMAFGLARMFGIRIPLNFNSPYKSRSLIEFWKRWHITLSRFLENYVHLPLSLYFARNYRTESKLLDFIKLVLLPVFITFLISGVWHGAGWTFILWGMMHGLLVGSNYLWFEFKKFINTDFVFIDKYRVNIFLTFITWVITMVMFRSDSISSAKSIYLSMFGFKGVSLPVLFENGLVDQVLNLLAIKGNFSGLMENRLVSFQDTFLILIAALIVFTLPNVYQFMSNYKDELYVEKIIYAGRFGLWRPNKIWAFIMAITTVFALLEINKLVPFIYFQF